MAFGDRFKNMIANRRIGQAVSKLPVAQKLTANIQSRMIERVLEQPEIANNREATAIVKNEAEKQGIRVGQPPLRILGTGTRGDGKGVLGLGLIKTPVRNPKPEETVESEEDNTFIYIAGGVVLFIGIGGIIYFVTKK